MLQPASLLHLRDCILRGVRRLPTLIMCPARLLFSFAVIAWLSLSARGEAADSPAPAPAAPAASAAEAPRAAEAPTSDWLPLFNGRDLEGWTQQGSARWRVEDGVIVGGQEGDPKRSGMLSTVEQFQDFELELEFMIDEHGKYTSGVYLRNDPKERGRERDPASGKPCMAAVWPI